MGIGVSMMLVGGGVGTEEGGIIGGVPGMTALVSSNISLVVPDVVVVTPNVVVVVGIVNETPFIPVSSKTERDIYCCISFQPTKLESPAAYLGYFVVGYCFNSGSIHSIHVLHEDKLFQQLSENWAKNHLLYLRW